MKERERFEKWFYSRGRQHNRLEILKSEQWAAWQASRRWISVSESLPEDDRLKLVWTRYSYEFAFYKKGEWHIKWFDERIGWRNTSITATHWRPLPEPPEEV